MAEAWDFQPGETLVWEGAPRPGVHGKAAEVYFPTQISDGDGLTTRIGFDTIAGGGACFSLILRIQMGTR